MNAEIGKAYEFIENNARFTGICIAVIPGIQQREVKLAVFGSRCLHCVPERELIPAEFPMVIIHSNRFVKAFAEAGRREAFSGSPESTANYFLQLLRETENVCTADSNFSEPKSEGNARHHDRPPQPERRHA